MKYGSYKQKLNTDCKYVLNDLDKWQHTTKAKTYEPRT